MIECSKSTYQDKYQEQHLQLLTGIVKTIQYTDYSYTVQVF